MICPLCKSDTTSDVALGPPVCANRDCEWTSDGSSKPSLFHEAKQCLRCGAKCEGLIISNTVYKGGTCSIPLLLRYLSRDGDQPLVYNGVREYIRPFDFHICPDGGFGVLRLVGFNPIHPSHAVDAPDAV